MLQTFGDEIWTADGPITSVVGFDYPTRMIVIRLSDGALFLCSPVALSDELQRNINLLGPVRHIVAPNTLHHKFIADWQDAYPHASFHAAPGLRTKRPDLSWDSELDDRPFQGWSDEIDQVVVRGNRITTEVVFFHRLSRTAIFTDLIQQFEPGWFTGWRSIIAKLDLMTSARPTVPRKFRTAFTDRCAAREALRRILIWPTTSVLAAHAAPITHDGRDAIAFAFEWLMHH